MQTQNLFNLPEMPQKREYNGTFAPNCDKEPQKRVKEHLLRGMSITVRQCWKLYGTSECRRIVSRLKKQGMDIGGDWYGKREYFIYKLNKEDKK